MLQLHCYKRKSKSVDVYRHRQIQFSPCGFILQHINFPLTWNIRTSALCTKHLAINPPAVSFTTLYTLFLKQYFCNNYTVCHLYDCQETRDIEPLFHIYFLLEDNNHREITHIKEWDQPHHINIRVSLSTLSVLQERWFTSPRKLARRRDRGRDSGGIREGDIGEGEFEGICCSLT